MNKKLPIASLLVLIWALPASADDPVLKKFEARYLGWKDVCAVLSMKTTTRSGSEREGEAKTCVLIDDHDAGLLRVHVLSPVGARGTEILSHVEDGGERKQWLYMPATKRPIPVDDARNEQPFMGTDFSYVDLSLNLIDAEDMEASGTGDCDGKPCTSYDIPPRPGEHQRRAWLITDTGALHHVDVEKDGEPLKRMDIGAETQSDKGYWLPSQVTMHNLRTGSNTSVQWKEIEFDTGLDDDYFDPDQIYGTGGGGGRHK